MNAELLLGAATPLALLAVAALLVRFLGVSIEDEEAVLVTSFGRLSGKLATPGWHFLPRRLLPWVRLRRVSLRRDFRHFEEIAVNDARGTTVIVDVWLELRIVDPERATFQVADWDRSLRNLATHSVISILGDREFHEILCDRTELGERLRSDIEHETKRWGIEVEVAYIRNVSLRPEISRQVFHTVAARLERAKADIEEEGRQRAALLEAETQAKVASMVAEAKGQYPSAVGRAFAALRHKPEVFAAYNELYRLSQLRPHRTVFFTGFEPGELRSIEAAMLIPGATAAPAAANGEAAEVQRQ